MTLVGSPELVKKGVHTIHTGGPYDTPLPIAVISPVTRWLRATPHHWGANGLVSLLLVDERGRVI